MLSKGGFRYTETGEHLPIFLSWIRLCRNPPMQHATCLRHVAYCHASATVLLIINLNRRNSLLIGKFKKSRGLAKSIPEKLALETPLRKLGPPNFHTLSPMNVSVKSPNFKKLVATVFCGEQKNYQGADSPPPPTPTSNRVSLTQGRPVNGLFPRVKG